MDLTEDTDEDVDFRPRRPAEGRRTADRGVMGDGERDCRLYECPVGTRRCTDGPPELEKPGVDGLLRALVVGCAVEPTGFLANPFTTRFWGSWDTAACGVCVGRFFPVCGLGLFSLDSLPSFPARLLARRSGVE